jgi:hypothetical protein
MIASVVDRSIRALAAARSNVAVESWIIERVVVRFMIAVSPPFATVVFAIESVSERVLAAEDAIRQNAVAPGMRDICVGTILLVQPGKSCPARVVLVFAIGRKNILVEASKLLDSDGVDGKARVSDAALALIEALVKARAAHDVSIATGRGFFGELAEVAGSERDVVVGNDDNIRVSGIGGKHAFVPASRYATIDAVWVVGDQRALRDADAGLGKLRISRVQKEVTLDGVAIGTRGLEHAGGACGRAIDDRDDGDFHGVESPHDRRVRL